MAARAVVIMQKKTVSAVTAKQEIVTAINTLHNCFFIIKKEIWNFTKSLFLSNNYLSVIIKFNTPARTRSITLHLIVLAKISLSLLTRPTAAAATAID